MAVFACVDCGMYSHTPLSTSSDNNSRSVCEKCQLIFTLVKMVNQLKVRIRGLIMDREFSVIYPGCPTDPVSNSCISKTKWLAHLPIRQEVVNQEPSVKDFKERWPALFQQKENNAEFQRFMAIHLELKFMAQLDMHSSELIKVIHAKGEATDQKTTDIMDKDLEQLTMAVFAIHREVGRTAGAT